MEEIRTEMRIHHCCARKKELSFQNKVFERVKKKGTNAHGTLTNAITI